MGKGSLLDLLHLRSRAPTLEDFRDRVARAVLRERPGAQVTRAEGAELDIKWPGMAEPREFTVADHYARCVEAPQYTNELIGHAASIISIAADPPRADWLTVIVVADGQPFGDDLPRPAVRRALVDGLVALVVIDTPRGYQFLSAPTLREELGLKEPALWDRALANTRERINLKKVPMDPRRATQIRSADGLMASLVLFDDYWDSDENTVAAPLVVALISHNHIVVAPLSDAVAIGRMREHIASVPRDREWITSDLIVRRDGAWEVLD